MSTEELPASPTPAPASPADVGGQLKQHFPALFGGAFKPLKLHIQADIQQRAPGVFSKQALSAFFRRYTGTTGYLVAMSRARQRFDLDGNPSGELAEVHKQAAIQELERRRGLHQAKLEQAEDGRRKRAALLRDFENTTLAPANFCALKGVDPKALEALLETARKEAQERPSQRPLRPDARRRAP